MSRAKRRALELLIEKMEGRMADDPSYADEAMSKGEVSEAIGEAGDEAMGMLSGESDSDDEYAGNPMDGGMSPGDEEEDPRALLRKLMRGGDCSGKPLREGAVLMIGRGGPAPKASKGPVGRK